MDEILLAAELTRTRISLLDYAEKLCVAGQAEKANAVLALVEAIDRLGEVL